mgnify:CR=1 FL=1
MFAKFFRVPRVRNRLDRLDDRLLDDIQDDQQWHQYFVSLYPSLGMNIEWVGGSDLSKLGFDRAEPAATGRPAYSPATLLSRWRGPRCAALPSRPPRRRMPSRPRSAHRAAS